MVKNNLKYTIHRAGDLPKGADKVQVAMHYERSMYGTRGMALLGHNGKVYSAIDRCYHYSRDIRDEPSLINQFAKLSGLTVAHLRKARKDWLAVKAKYLEEDRLDDLKKQAEKAGYRLIKEPK